MINDFCQSEVDESIEQSPSTTNNLLSLDLNELLNDPFLQSFTNNSEFPGASIIYEPNKKINFKIRKGSKKIQF